MRSRVVALAICGIMLLAGCGGYNSSEEFSGRFEAQEVVVSSLVDGKITRWHAREGAHVSPGDTICVVDTTLLALQHEEVEAAIRSLTSQLPNGILQTPARQERTSLSKSASGILAQIAALRAKQGQLEYLLTECAPCAPRKGVILQVYAHEGELSHKGRPLVRIADLRELTLRVYLPYDAMCGLSVGDPVNVLTDSTGGKTSRRAGVISWISEEAEFTPKSVQGRAMRDEQVYAVKVRVPNADGTLKRGMHGVIQLSSTE